MLRIPNPQCPYCTFVKMRPSHHSQQPDIHKGIIKYECPLCYKTAHLQRD